MTDDYLLDDLERSQLEATRRRRAHRSGRYYRMLFAVLGFLALAVLAAPSIVSHTGIGRSILASTAATYHWQATADAIDVGWITPLTLQNLKLVGPSGETVVQVERANTALTVTQLIGFDPAETGEITLRGVQCAAVVDNGYSSIEADLAEVWADEPQAAPSNARAEIQLQNVSAAFRDRVDDRTWVLKQSNVGVRVDGGHVTADVSGVVREPDGDEGGLQSRWVWNDSNLKSPRDVAASPPQNATVWELFVETESFPLSVMQLMTRRLGDSGAGLPRQVTGDTTGRMSFVGSTDGSVRGELGDVRIRNLQTIVPASTSNPSGPRIDQWNNRLATLNGRLLISDGWLVGQGLQLTTDFGSATIDGSFPTTISLVGTNDNPIRWLQALDGRAEVDIDLAALNQSLPGLIPLRADATLVSGRARGGIENTRPVDPATGKPSPARSRLTLTSESLRARADGRIVVIDPIEISALVGQAEGHLRAERFKFASSFGTAFGSGTLESGTAELEIDFGRLYTMLRPVIDFSELSLGGNAGGKIQWSVKQGKGYDRWELSGNGEANDLLVTLPDGQRFKRSIVQGDLSAAGRWDGRTLQELTSAQIALRSSGVLAAVELTEPVEVPTGDSIYPVRLETDGRLENLSESLRPWLPETLVEAEGRLTGSAIARIGRSSGSLSQATFVLQQPRINYDGQWFSQPKLDVNFNGVFAWPSGNFSSQETTVVGESLSVAIRGEASRETTNLDVAWEADLEGLQRSFNATLARAASNPQARPISYRATQATGYRIGGRCKGKATITDQTDLWNIATDCSVNNLVLYDSADDRPVPPGSTFGLGFGQQRPQLKGERLWFEPRIKLTGPIKYHPATGAIRIPGLQLACDWFAGTIAGSIENQDGHTNVTLSGPTRLKMEAAAERLSAVLGRRIWARGLHESEINIQATIKPGAEVTYVATTDIGWEQCDVEGVRFAAATLPLRVNEQSVRVAKTSVPIVSILETTVPRPTPTAQANFAADIRYSADPMTIEFDAGSKLQSLQITPASAATWLKYLAPLAANATRIDGSLNLNFERAVLVPSDPNASLVRGSVDVEQMTLSSGPLSDRLIQGVRQVKQLAQLAGGQADPAGPQTWIEMPPQNVEFSFENGVATHQRMYFNIDRAILMTSGRVGTDSRINLVAQVPLDARWLGSDLKGLAGQTITLPITGTLSRPTLDDSAVRNVVRELGTKASAEVIQNRLDGLLKKELGSSIDQLNQGLEKILGF